MKGYTLIELVLLVAILIVFGAFIFEVCFGEKKRVVPYTSGKVVLVHNDQVYICTPEAGR